MSDIFTKDLTKQQEVVAATNLKGVPEGTSGKIMLSNGLDWVRYWVKFENGVEMGSLHRNKLVSAEDWDLYLEEREDEDLTLEETTDSADEESSSAGSGGGVEVNGVLIPQLLLDRTQAALDRFGVSR
ncbi:MAG: hypothetical protein CL522_00640 [Actinobacteria bacterium]|nr:hypothetical protein [Actinomycetota bacterium]|tara:strand:- start:2534 stop:2917 length:384 start_codon:yes stop_codon:yes gene_type:complete